MRLWQQRDVALGECIEHERAWLTTGRRCDKMSYWVLQIPWLCWKDLKWARSAHSTADPMNPSIGWFRPVLGMIRTDGEPSHYRWSWRAVKTWRVSHLW